MIISGLLGSGAALTSADANIYRCQTPDGTVFSDTPCSEDARPEVLRESSAGIRLGTQREHSASTPEPAEAHAPSPETESPCRDFTSTELRRMRIRGEVKRGMRREDVREALGRPAEQHEHPRELWIYRERERGFTVAFKRVYFQDGCVTEILRQNP